MFNGSEVKKKMSPLNARMETRQDALMPTRSEDVPDVVTTKATAEKKSVASNTSKLNLAGKVGIVAILTTNNLFTVGEHLSVNEANNFSIFPDNQTRAEFELANQDSSDITEANNSAIFEEEPEDGESMKRSSSANSYSFFYYTPDISKCVVAPTSNISIESASARTVIAGAPPSCVGPRFRSSDEEEASMSSLQLP